MKKEDISKLLFIISILLIVLFVVLVIVDYSYYNETFSAPFSALILVRALEFVLPSFILTAAGLILKRKKQ